MINNRYQIFINQTLQLAETIVIKSAQTAEALNSLVFMNSGGTAVASADPLTWKYYLNISGEYHDTDQVMTVVSMDTLNEIIFNKENLKIHRATARGYVYGSRQYTELVRKYPDQEQLILGILYPCDIHEAVNALDGKILSYPTGLIEANEYSLVETIQKWIYAYKSRWTIPAFNLTDELYEATALGIMYLGLVPCILTARLKACNTNEAHSFDIRQYLGSHGYLDSYVDTLTTKQALFFYRNIAYIERNPGQRDTFDTLLEHIMTERFVPLGEYSMKHDVTEQLDNLYPEVIFRKKQLNMGIRLDPDNQTSIEQMLVKEMNIAPGNQEDLPVVAATARSLMKNSPSNVVATKVLESSMVDESNSSPWILSEVLFNEWIHLSSVGIYTAFVNINNPRTGEKLPLTAKESFVLAMYAFNKSLGLTPTNIKPVFANRVQRLPTPTDPYAPSVDDIYSIVDSKLLGREVAVQALSIQPIIDALMSTDAFYTLCVEIFEAVQMQRGLIAAQEHHARRGMVQAMCTRIYSDNWIELESPDTLYDNWLSARSIDLSEFTRAEYELLYNDIVAQATGLSLHPTQSLKEMQAAMVSMFTQLSSYGIQVITEINDTNIRKTDWPGVRLGDVGGELGEHRTMPYLGTEILDVRSGVEQPIHVALNRFSPSPELSSHTTQKYRSDSTLHTTTGSSPIVWGFNAMLPKMRVESREVPTGPLPPGMQAVLGVNSFLALTDAERMTIRDIYSNLDMDMPTDILLSQIITITELLPMDLGSRDEQLDRAITNRVLGKTYTPE